VRTGGSLLADSDPPREEEETRLKAESMFRVLAGQSPRVPVAAPPAVGKSVAGKAITPSEVEDGRKSMYKVFVDGKVVTAADFNLCWHKTDLSVPPNGVIEPFIQILADKGIQPVDKSIKLLTDKTRIAYLPLERYDIDIELARGFPAATCQRWCVLPFDRMSKSVLVATANPFNQQAAKELAEATSNRLLWYLVQPAELIKYLRKTFR